MAEIIIKTIIKQRYDTSSSWTVWNPVLHAGEIGIESDTGKVKCGDGSTTWQQLPYMYSGLDENEINDLFK